MSEEFEWHDMCRKHCGSFDEAFGVLQSPGMQLMMDNCRWVLQRKLDEGYELIEPEKVHHLTLTEYTGTLEGLGPWFIELQITARLRKL